MRRLLLALLLAAGCAAAQTKTQDFLTGGLVNCRAWRGSTGDMRIGYVAGILDGYAAGAFASGQKDASPPFSYLGKIRPLTNGDVIAGVDEVCGRPENMLVPAILAMVLFSMKAGGTATWDEVQTFDRGMRAVSK